MEVIQNLIIEEKIVIILFYFFLGNLYINLFIL